MNEMPAVKWVHQDHLEDDRHLLDHAFEGAQPVMTLDAIEAWLKQSYAKLPDYWSDERAGENYYAIDDLLAQVQAWKELAR